MKTVIKRYRLSRYHVKAIIALFMFILTFITTTIVYVVQAKFRQDTNVSSAVVPVGPGLTLLTFASHQADFLCRLLTSAVLNGIAVKVLGFDNDRQDALFRKVTTSLDELKKRRPDEIIMFVDAFDVVITGTAETIVSEFLQIGSDLVFAAEKGCWPFMDGRSGGEFICQHKYPESPTPYRYLNSGAWIGYVHAAVQAFEEMMVLPEAKVRAIDQELAAIVFFNHQGSITLDYHTRIFQCVHLSSDDLQFQLRDQHTVVYNQITNTYPPILHFNGNGKEVQEYYHERLGLLDLSQSEIEKIQTSSSDLIDDVEYPKICPEFH